ncbi:GNAT family N-acetyltransferase [Streptomyces liangshanensis]|uniref:GNAT family N-acetyltransferase n=1 Tax=Streptomyces liangshanensis TaxID=2717324 RepID=UPI0036DE8F2E
MATQPQTRTTPASPTTTTTVNGARGTVTPSRFTPSRFIRSTAVPAPPAGPAPGPVLTTELVRDIDGFAALAPAWNDLYRRSRTATPFQSHAWLHSWWLSYGTPGRLRVVLVHRGGDLVAAAPLMLIHRPFPVLIPLGGPISDFSDVLLDDTCADAAAALAKALARAARTAVIDLREVRPGAAAERVHACWPGPRRRLADSPCLELPAVPMDELLGRLASARAQRARAKLRKLDALGIEERIVPGDEIPGAVGRLLELHRLQWQGRGVTPEHLSTRFSEHLTRSVRSMAEQGDAMITEFRLAGELVASDLTLMSPQLAGGYLYGADPVLRAKKVDVATMLLRTCARQISADGRSTLSMLRGNEPYKHHWRPDTVCNQRFLLARTYLTPWLHLLAARAAGRGRAAALVKRLRRGGDKA